MTVIYETGEGDPLLEIGIGVYRYLKQWEV